MAVWSIMVLLVVSSMAVWLVAELFLAVSLMAVWLAAVLFLVASLMAAWACQQEQAVVAVLLFGTKLVLFTKAK
jgi:hypothetical protein